MEDATGALFAQLLLSKRPQRRLLAALILSSSAALPCAVAQAQAVRTFSSCDSDLYPFYTSYVYLAPLLPALNPLA
ncbi:MAG: hypothetical protein DYG89_15060 [Caldilinea sp. CFX5]|nr:hypothetical protein [Caldilinea sp. CFX5]